jgi:hypothetical protein
MAYAYVKRHIDEYMEYFFGSFAEPAEKQVVAGGLRNDWRGAREKRKCGNCAEKFSRGACVGKMPREKKKIFRKKNFLCRRADNFGNEKIEMEKKKI